MSGPPKYTNLLRAAEVTSVPVPFCLDEALLGRLIDHYGAVNAGIEAVLAEIALTSGAVLDRQSARLEEAVAMVSLAPGWDDVLSQAIGGALPDWRDRPLAVRSAAWTEDAAASSGAGLYRSLLGLCGAEAVGAAVLDVWRSFFRRAALIERLAGGTLCDGRRMNVIVQPMVPAAAAGVVFSADPLSGGPAVCEYKVGLGADLVAGSVSGTRLRAGDRPADPADALGAAGARAVFDAAARLAAHFGREVDVEWVWDGMALHVVQVRPISTTAFAGPWRPAEPVARVLPLYDSEDADLAVIAPQPEYVRYFRQKRRPLHLLSRAFGLHCAPAFVLQVNRAGLSDPVVGACLAELARHERVVIDASDRVRQMIVSGGEVLATLDGVMGDPQAVRTVVLRVFVAGQIGFITQRDGTADIVMEYSRDGLLALNRGTAEVRRAVVGADGAGRPGWLDEAAAATVAAVAAEAEQRFGRVQLEWVSHTRGLTLVDYSPLPEGARDALAGWDPDIVAKGFAQGPVLRIADSAILADISEGPSISIGSVPEAEALGPYLQSEIDRMRALPDRPIVVCSRPYALLAALIPHASGFVFATASLLSHLSILIRESGKPALASRELFERLVDGEILVLDVADAATASLPFKAIA